MKRIKALTVTFFVLVFAFVVVQAESLNSLSFSATSGKVSASGGTYTLTDFTSHATMSANISDMVKKILGENGGSITVSCRISVTNVEGQGHLITMSLSGTGESYSKLATNNTEFSCTANISADKLDSTINLVFSNIDPEKISEISIRNVTITGKPVENTPSPSPSVSPSDDPEVTPSPTATQPPTASPSSATPDPTAKATPKPTIAYEPTKDTWDDSNKVTNAPPTPPVDIGDIELATSVAESTSEPDQSGGMTSGSSINKGLIILFVVLLVLLGGDIAAIFIRKRYAPAALSAGATSVHRNIKDENETDFSDHVEGNTYDYDLQEQDSSFDDSSEKQ